MSLQDLGAAGLTSSASEMAAKGGVGLDIDCAQVPLREPGMEPFEIMVSESQERMLCVVEPDQLDAVIAVCARWETLATPIGDGDGLRPPAGALRATRWWPTCPSASWSTTARSTTSSPRRRQSRSTPAPAPA